MGTPSEGRVERVEKGVRLAVLRGDLTEVEADALVNAANNRGYMGGGVAGALKRKGGAEIEREALAQGPWPVGEAIVTGAGRLKARYVIHAATMALDFRTSPDLIRRAARSALQRARDLGLERVAFPSLGTGVGGFPYREAARIMLEEALAHIREGTTLKEVLFVLREREGFDAFREALEGGTGEPL